MDVITGLKLQPLVTRLLPIKGLVFWGVRNKKVARSTARVGEFQPQLEEMYKKVEKNNKRVRTKEQSSHNEKNGSDTG